MKRYYVDKPFIFTLFGASGDLAKVKIFPALYALANQKRFVTDFSVVGFARTKKHSKTFRKEFILSVQENAPDQKAIDHRVLESLADRVDYFTGQYDQKSSFWDFANFLLQKTKGKKMTHLMYLAVPPQVFPLMIKNIAELRTSLGDDIRLIIEKPFGFDEKSARELFHHVSLHFPPEKVFLLDHYLGKETVQSILTLRYANSILNTLLKGELIANIQITAFEDLSVKNRISYFEQVGIIKDMIQSHLLQILSLLTMELPVEQEASSIHREKFAVLSALKYRGYETGLVLGQHESYQKILGVRKGSKIPTFAALRLFIDRQDWYRVPIYIRTGKMLNKKHTYVVVEFKKHNFQWNDKRIQSNRLILELFPNERIILKLFTKSGGSKDALHDLGASQSLACFGDDCLPEHGRLLLNVFQEDQSNFLNFEEIIATWKFTDKLLRCVEKKQFPIHIYPDYSHGPEVQNAIPRLDHFEWFDLT